MRNYLIGLLMGVALGVLVGLVIALIIQTNILQMDMIYPAGLPQVWL